MTKRNLKAGVFTVFGIAMAFMILMQIVVVISMFPYVGIIGILVVIFSLYLYLQIIDKVGILIIKERENGHTG